MSEKEIIKFDEPEVLSVLEVEQKLDKSGRYTHRSARLSIQFGCDLDQFGVSIHSFMEKATDIVKDALERLKENEPKED